MTAVEWLVEEFEVISNSTGISKIEKIELYNKAIEQAQEIYKEQIINALNNGFEENRPYVDHSEDYYNETYNKK
jgi:hypothetical protein